VVLVPLTVSRKLFHGPLALYIPAVLDHPSSLIVGSSPSIGAAGPFDDDPTDVWLRCHGLRTFFGLYYYFEDISFFFFLFDPSRSLAVIMYGVRRRLFLLWKIYIFLLSLPRTVGGLTFTSSWTISSSNRCLSFSNWSSLMPLYTSSYSLPSTP
jgi:hypothetical protein